MISSAIISPLYCGSLKLAFLESPVQDTNSRTEEQIMLKDKIRRFIYLFLISLLVSAFDANAKGVSLIRDAEIEDTIKSYLFPLFKAANLSTDNINVVIINNPAVNAFVADGSKVYIYTGLLLKASSANQIIAVLAHETGHIVGGHVIRLKESMRIAARYTLLSAMVGGLVAVASKRPDAGFAVMAGGIGSAQANMMTYRVSEENSADSIAVDLLVKTHESLQGLVDVMRLIKKESLLYPNTQFVYYRTHPLTKDRIAFAEKAYADHKDIGVNMDYEKSFARIKAKLLAFLGDADKIYNIVNGRDDTDSLYALSIYYLRKNNVAAAVKVLDRLIAREPENPYFYELKGQVLFENGKYKESLAPYRKALALKPDNALMVAELAHAEIEGGSKEDLLKVGERINSVLLKEKFDPSIWRLYATCYSRAGDKTKEAYGMAEYNLLRGDYGAAGYYAEKANKNVLEGTPMWFNIQDILLNVKNNSKGGKK